MTSRQAGSIHRLLQRAGDPASGDAGQAFFDTATKTIRVYSGTAWRALARFVATDGKPGVTVHVGANAPTGQADGDLWVDPSDTANSQYGLPTGGTAGQILQKASSADGAAAWANKDSDTGWLDISTTSWPGVVHVRKLNGYVTVIIYGVRTASLTTTTTATTGMGQLTSSFMPPYPLSGVAIGRVGDGYREYQVIVGTDGAITMYVDQSSGNYSAATNVYAVFGWPA